MQQTNKLIFNYKKTSHIPCIFNNQSFIVIRSFKRSNEDYFVIVNINTLEIKIVAQNLCAYRKSDQDGRYCSLKELESSVYYRSLYYFNNIKDSRENQGLKNIPGVKGCFVSIDMCPSIKMLEHNLFDAILKTAKRSQEINLLIAVSGLWIATHLEDFMWLQTLPTQNIKITWVNHSFSHIFYPDKDFTDNFLLLPNTDIENEILQTEHLLIEMGELPSLFFRFPGLVASQEILDILTSYGLIQLGASAWIHRLPEHETVKDGDIVLIHGNGNEDKVALDKLIKLVQSDQFLWKNLQKELCLSNTISQN
jgi:hypothetical protein